MRTSIALDQARTARARGFTTILFFLAADGADIHVERVRARALAGGHAAAEAEIRTTYLASIAMLSEAISAFNVVECFDTTVHNHATRWVASAREGEITLRCEPTPAWLHFVLHQSTQ
jgi:predicted ABC-type ATPase